jgi:catechol 2,3-dioxygenase
LGLKLLTRIDNIAILGLDSVGPLVALTGKPEARPRPPRTTGLYHFAILLPSRVDFAQSLRHLVQNQYPLQGAADHGVSEALYLVDPDGNGIEMYIDKSRDEWPWLDGHLQMVTDPLNVQDLLSSHAGSWSGLPEGTRIGHVHLQVADLGQAERFYGDLLGFDLMQRFGHSALFFSAGGYHHHIGVNTWAGTGAPAPPSDAVGLRHFTVHLPNEAALSRAAERIEAAGIAFEHPPPNGYTANALLLKDPSDNSVLLDIRTVQDKEKP